LSEASLRPLLLYYGAADTVIGLAIARFSDVMTRVLEAG